MHRNLLIALCAIVLLCFAALKILAAPAPSLHAYPVLLADQDYEQGAVQEPDVHLENGTYKMWYTAGWNHSVIAYATSPDGVAWVKRGTVMGMGTGGFAGAVAHHSVLIRGGMYYLFFADAVPPGMAEYLAVSTDGLHFDHPQKILSPGVSDMSLANTAVWVEGRDWYMLYESMTPGSIWRLFLAEGTDVYHWRKVAGPLTDLSYGGAYGGPWISGHAGAYTLTYHAAMTADRPTDIYQATSIDLLHWTKITNPLVIHDAADGYDQAADPSIIGNRMWYSVMNNDKPSGMIMLAELNK